MGGAARTARRAEVRRDHRVFGPEHLPECGGDRGKSSATEGSARVLLVTDAFHVRRSLACFAKAGGRGDRRAAASRRAGRNFAWKILGRSFPSSSALGDFDDGPPRVDRPRLVSYPRGGSERTIGLALKAPRRASSRIVGRVFLGRGRVDQDHAVSLGGSCRGRRVGGGWPASRPLRATRRIGARAIPRGSRRGSRRPRRPRRTRRSRG